MNRRQTYEVTVTASALGELILAVHQAAGHPGGHSTRRWRYGNIVGIGAPRVRDLPLAKVRVKHVVERHTVAAITVTVHRRVTVDVFFAVDGPVASAQFLCATGDSESIADQEAALAEYLATDTSRVLVAAHIATRLSTWRESRID